MPSQVALIIFLAFILWLYVRDRELRPMSSWVLWVPLFWLVVIGSRPLSIWLTPTTTALKGDQGAEEGDIIDVLVFSLLMLVGTYCAARRKLSWSKFINENRWLACLFAYCGLSVLWSDYPIVGLKRWTKDVTNVTMIILMFTEVNPVQAVKAVWARYVYVVVPISVLFIKYFPDLGRLYNRWTYVPSYVGVTTEKNTLGAVVLVSGLILVWDLLERWQDGWRAMNRVDIINRAILLLMTMWLIFMADSSTALVCFVLGVVVVISLQNRALLRQARYMGAYLVILCLSGLLFYSSGAYETFLTMLGEDPTLTGRTDTWATLLQQPINPLLGTGGYRSFWTSSFAESTKDHYYFYINQSHNGYLEMYLNNGLIGLSLLFGLIISSVMRLKKALLTGNRFAILQLTFLLIVVFSNWTEATFNTLNPMWFVFLMASMSASSQGAWTAQGQRRLRTVSAASQSRIGW